MRKLRVTLAALLAVMLCLSSVPILAQTVKPVPAPVEVLALRAESSKTYRLGERDYRTVMSSAPMHYKQDYGDSGESWKDISTAIHNNRVLAAPYTLDIDPQQYTITMTDRRTGSVVTMRLKSVGAVVTAKSLTASTKAGSEITWSDVVPDGDLKIIAKDTSVAFQYIMKSKNAPTRVVWDVTQVGDGIEVRHNITDAAGPESDVRLDVKWNGTTLQETALVSAKTQYPVLMDPELVVRPDASPETDSVDGLVETVQGSAAWGTLTGAASGTAETTNDFNDLWIESSAVSSKWDKLGRIFLLFDTSALPDGCTITDATLSLRGASLKEDNLNISPTYGIYASSPASDNDLVSADFDQVAGVAFSDTIVTFAAWDTTDYNDFALNAAGIAAIDDDGVSKFSFRNKNYDVDNTPPAWSSDENTFVLVYMADEGENRAPKLTITYSTPGGLTLGAATNVKNTSARLPGELTGGGDDDYTITVFWGETDEGEVPGAWDHSSVPTSPAQPQGAATFYLDVDSLTPGTLYFYKARAVSVGETVWSATRSFTPPVPSITSEAATNVAITTAKLNAAIASLTDATAEVRFQYYEDGGAFGDNDTAWVGGYSEGQSPYYDASGLTEDTLHYFRAQMRVDDTHVYSGATLSFTTDEAAGLSAPTNLKALAEAERIILSWVKGEGSTGTMVRFALGGFPDDVDEGTLVGNTTSSSLAHAGLTPGTTYYYALWGYSGGNVSDGNATIMWTTTGGESAEGGEDAPDTPALWFISTDYTRFDAMPLYSQINDFIAALGMPLGTGWFLGALLLCVAGGLLAGYRSGDAVVGVITIGALMLLACILHLLPMWMVAFAAVFFAGATKLSSNRRAGLQA